MAAAALTVVVALAALLPADHYYFWRGDTAAAYYGWWYHLGEMVRHGQWATIDPHAWRAGNLAAEGQWGLWSPLTIAIGCLKRSLLIDASAACIIRVSFVIRDIRNPECILLKKSIEWLSIFPKSCVRISVSTFALTQVV